MHLALTLAASIGLLGPIAASAAPKLETLRFATWNVAWYANEPVTAALAEQCRGEAAKWPKDMDARPTPQCRKGAPYRGAGAYVLMARHAASLDADIVALQEVEGITAVQHLFDGASPVSNTDGGYISPGSYEIGVYGKGGWQKTAIAVRKSILAPGKQVTFKEFGELGAPLKRDHRGALEALVPLKNGVTLSVLSVHLKSHCSTQTLDSGGADCPELAEQAPIISEWIRDHVTRGQPFVVMGDMNRAFTSSPEQCSHQDPACSRVALGPWLDGNNFAQAPVIIPTAKLLHPDGCFDPAFGPSAIEHIILGGGAEAGYVRDSATSRQYIDSRTNTPITNRSSVRGVFSDHCVVSVQWQL